MGAQKHGTTIMLFMLDKFRMIRSRRMRWTGHVAREKKNAYMILVRKPEGKRPLGRSRGRMIILRWILELGWGGMDWIDLAQDRDQWRAIVNTVIRVP
jgi:hypothetical protein